MPCHRIRAETAAVDQGCRTDALSRARAVAGRPVPCTLATNEFPSGRVSVMLSASAERCGAPGAELAPFGLLRSGGPGSGGPGSGRIGSGRLIR